MQSTKVDIVYYTVPTDFEMEFNLGGCCHMRLLTSLTHDRKEYINALSRAVERSKIIIACGPIFGEMGLIHLTSRAIGRPLTIINNKDYGIVDDQNVHIIDGSLPLVTSSGFFGGIIIESGPQTIIILSDNKAVRKSVMDSLIHPYIREVNIMELRGITNSHPDTFETEAPQTSVTPEPVIETAVVPNPVVSEPSLGESETSFESGKEIAEKENAEELVDETIENSAEEIISAAPQLAVSEEALKEIAEEINRRAEEINAPVHPEEAEELSEETEDFTEEDPLKRTENTESSDLITELTISEESFNPEENYDLPESEPEIDFKIDDIEPESQESAPEQPAEENDSSVKESGKSFVVRGGDLLTSAHPMFIFEDESGEYYTETEIDAKNSKPKKSNKSRIASIIIITSLIIIVLATIGYFLVYLPLSNGISVTEYLKSLYNYTASYIKSLFAR